jgi:hypothetical protein
MGSQSKPQSQSETQSQSKSTEKSEGGNSGDSKGAPQPKILNENPPSNPSDEVKQHNKEMEDRHEKPFQSASDEDVKSDKVSKGFWAGKSHLYNCCR